MRVCTSVRLCVCVSVRLCVCASVRVCASVHLRVCVAVRVYMLFCLYIQVCQMKSINRRNLAFLHKTTLEKLSKI